MSTESRLAAARTLLRPAAPKPRAAVWAAGLGVDLSTLSDGAAKGAAEAAAPEAVAPAAAAVAVEPAPAPAALAAEDRQSLESVLEELLVFDGSIGVALVDAPSGMVLGEGSWMYILEDVESAQARGAKVYAEIAGYGSTCEAFHRVRLEECGEEPARAIGIAMKEAGIAASDVHYANLHGTSTQLNDRI